MKYPLIVITILGCVVALIAFLVLCCWIWDKLAHKGVPSIGLNNTAYTVPMQNPENRLYASGASASASCAETFPLCGMLWEFALAATLLG